MIALAVSAACTSVLVKLIIREKNDSDWWHSRTMEAFKKVETLTPWLQSERERSEDLLNSIGKGSPFLHAMLKKWSQEKNFNIGIIESEINALKNIESVTEPVKEGQVGSIIGPTSLAFENDELQEVIVNKSKKIYCIDCGAGTINLDDKFCSKCGSRFF